MTAAPAAQLVLACSSDPGVRGSSWPTVPSSTEQSALSQAAEPGAGVDGPSTVRPGRRLFDVLPSLVELEIVRVIDTPEATHIRYRIRR